MLHFKAALSANAKFGSQSYIISSVLHIRTAPESTHQNERVIELVTVNVSVINSRKTSVKQRQATHLRYLR